MLYGISLSSTSAQIERSRMENVSNNLANMNTVGFKQDLLTVMQRPVESRTWMVPEEIGRVEYRNNLLDRMGGGVWLHNSHSVLEQGNPMVDDNPMHFALEGEGFFTMKDVHSGEVFYSRAGNFDVNSEGIMQTADGLYHVLDAKGDEINITKILGENGVGQLQVDTLGRIQVSTETGTIDSGQAIGVAVFENEDAFKLEKLGNNMFIANDPEIVANARQLVDLEGVESVMTQVHQNSLEGSGVDPVDLSREMIEVSRAYERAMNMISMQNGTVENLVSRVGRPI